MEISFASIRASIARIWRRPKIDKPVEQAVKATTENSIDEVKPPKVGESKNSSSLTPVDVADLNGWIYRSTNASTSKNLLDETT